MLSCQQLTELATAYMEGDLPWRQRLRIKVHLSMCRRCLRYLEQLRTVVALLRCLPSEPAPPELIQTLLPLLHQNRDRPA